MSIPKIKIQDDSELREILDELYEKASQIILCKYALLLATHILETIAYDDMDNPILQAGYKANEGWQAGKIRSYDVRQAGFQIHRLARSSQDTLTRTALRVAGQAVGVAHMREHAMVASDYAIKVINLLCPKDAEAVRQERLWQIKCLQRLNSLDI